MKLTKTLSPAIVIVTFLFSPAMGATLFQDDFSNATTSQKNWANVDNISLTLTGGAMTLVNNISYLSLVTHAVTCSTFTYSARLKPLTSNYQIVGLAFCGGVHQISQTQGYYGGYVFTIAKGQQFSIYRMGAASIDVLYQTWHSYVRDGENVLTVSKAGSHIVLFCNGVFVYGFTDTTFSKGEIGIGLNAGESVQVDDVLLTDAFKAGQDVKYFKDSFDNPGLYGWNLLVNGWNNAANTTVANGLLTLVPDPSPAFSIIYTDGAYANAPARVRVRYVSGDSAKFYGLVYLQLSRSFAGGSSQIGAPGQSGFVLSAGRSYGFFSSGSWIPQTSTTIHGRGDWDTLSVSAGLDYSINGVKLTTYNEQVFNYNAVGLYIDNGVTVQYDDFMAGDSTSGVIYGDRRIISGTRLARIPQNAAMYDLSGRAVLQPWRTSPDRTSSGMYVLPGRLTGIGESAVLRIR